MAAVQNWLAVVYFYLPIGIIGIWRWLVWIFKKAVGSRYRPLSNSFKASVSIVTPVYNEDPEVFKKALLSWQLNKPLEIIAVIDYTDRQSINLFRNFSKNFPHSKLIITKEPGKREALAKGLKKARGQIVALVDSDTIWDKQLLKHALPPFIDKQVAGVAPRQTLVKAETLAQKIFDIQLDLRYFDEFQFLAAAGDALVCISGRTAFYRRSVILPMCDDLVNETFMGKKVISGDDKRLTYLVLKHGWKVAYQHTALVSTPGVEDLLTYLKQRLRWIRNSLRADIKAIIEGWTFKRPALAFFQIDKIIQVFAIILSPIYFFVSLFFGLYIGALIIALWWLVSRAVKIYPHLVRKPADILVLPSYILYTFLSALLKIYAFFTLNTQSWITRWDPTRLPKLRFVNYMPALGMTFLLITVATNLVILQKQQLLNTPEKVADIALNKDEEIDEGFIEDSQLVVNIEAGLTDEKFLNDNGQLVKKYYVEKGDTISGIAALFNVDPEDVLEANKNILPNWNVINPGTPLTIPYHDFEVDSPKEFAHTIKNLPELSFRYDRESNIIHAFGRGNSLTLKTLAEKFGKDHIEETAPKEWLLKSKLKLENGVTIVLNKDEVTRLKLKSNPGRDFVWLKTWGGNIYIDGVTISSWDTNKNDYDRNDKDGRAHIMIKYSSRMDILNSDLGYLGFYPHNSSDQSSYGVAWKLPDGTAGKYFVTGEVKNSKFHHNYFGAYTYGATGMVWKNNVFQDNIEYGLDPHDDSNGFLVENNRAFNNGNHGIIFSKRCVNNIIRNNMSYNNKLHGIMLDRNSDHNLVEKNTVYGNRDGIALFDSNNNIIKNNNIHDNVMGLRANASSKDNKFLENNLSGNKEYGVYLYGQANANTISKNLLKQNKVAVYIKSASNQIVDNTITENSSGVLFIDFAANNKLSGNTVSNNLNFGVHTKTSPYFKNMIGINNISGNKKDISVSTRSD